MLLNAIKPKPNSFDMSCSNVHIKWTNIYSLLTKRRHFFCREQSLLSKSYAALGWPLQCWREMSGQELGRIIPCPFLPWNEFIQVWLLDIKDWLNQGNPENKQGQEISWRELDTAEEGQPAMPEKGLQKQGKGEGARYPSPTVACAAPSPCWKWQHFDANDTKLLSHHHVSSFSKPSRRNNTHWNQETLIYKWHVVWLQVGHLTSDSVFL